MFIKHSLACYRSGTGDCPFYIGPVLDCMPRWNRLSFISKLLGLGFCSFGFASPSEGFENNAFSIPGQSVVGITPDRFVTGLDGFVVLALFSESKTFTEPGPHPKTSYVPCYRLQPIYLQISWLIVVDDLKKKVLAQTKNETKGKGVNGVGSRVKELSGVALPGARENDREIKHSKIMGFVVGQYPQDTITWRVRKACSATYQRSLRRQTQSYSQSSMRSASLPRR